MSKAWGKHQYRRESPAPGGGDLEAIFLTNGTSDPATVQDPTGMLTVTRSSQSKFKVDLPDRWVYLYPIATYLDSAPAGTRAIVTELRVGAAFDPNGFSVTLVDPAGAPVAETTGKPVQVRIAAYNEKGRAS
jgi:hypothetical protein